MENRSFWCSGRPRAAQKPFKKEGGKDPYLLKGFLGRPGPPRAPKRPISIKSLNPPLLNPPLATAEHLCVALRPARVATTVIQARFVYVLETTQKLR